MSEGMNKLGVSGRAKPCHSPQHKDYCLGNGGFILRYLSGIGRIIDCTVIEGMEEMRR